MKKILLVTSLLFTLSNLCYSQYYYQYFDGTDTSQFSSIQTEIDTSSSNIWQIGAPQKTIFNSASTIPNAIVTDTLNNYPVNNTSSFLFKINVWQHWGIFALQWVQKLDMDTTFDGGIIEYSTDTGQTWVNVFNNPFVYSFYGFDIRNADTLTSGEFAFSGTDTTWKNIWLCFDFSWLSSFNYDTVQFRFTFKSDSVDNAREGWVIDNMFAASTIVHTVKNSEQTEYLNVYPNPSKGIVNVELEKIQDFHIIEQMELTDLSGRIINRWNNLPTKFWFESGNYPPGMYLLKVKSNLKTEIRPLIFSGNR